MDAVRLILALHDHQPVGNFDGVFEASYKESYLPFLDTLERYPEIAFALHTSGPLVEWLVEQHPEYIARVRALARTGRVEILGGGFYEPILTMIPHRDRVGQIRDFTRYLEDLFETRVRGMWMPERVWEQHLVGSLVEAGVEYTVLDDFHFQRSGLDDDQLFGYYLTEDDGRILKVFPICERLRYLVPFKEPHDTYEYLKALSQRQPGGVAVFADDGEKFGTWPGTHELVHQNGWLNRFCDMIAANAGWLQTCTFAQTVDATLPLGKVYLPDSSYREMTEWVLPAHQFQSFMSVVQQTKDHPVAGRMRPFLRAGGSWRNFRSKYAESDEMYSRMLGLSRRLATMPPTADEELLLEARQELYRSQCNCPYWHGAFGGLYLPHLRNAIYRHLITAHDMLDAAEGRIGPRVAVEVGDFNLDARQEVRLENEQLIAFVRPALGGHVYELDVRRPRVNVLATLDRRPEPYHDTIRASVRGEQVDDGRASITDKVVLKRANLDQALVYDRHPRKSLVDHFFPADATLADLIACRDLEQGDFATGAYLATVQRGRDSVQLVMERPGRAGTHLIKLRKSLRLAASGSSLEVAYELSDLPPGVPLHFGVEMNVAALAGHADDRYYSTPDGNRLGLLDCRLDLPASGGLTLTDEWLDLDVALAWSRPARLWCFPVETVSQSEAGFEGVYQSSAVLPHWTVMADARRRWEIRIAWSFARAGERPFLSSSPALGHEPAAAIA